MILSTVTRRTVLAATGAALLADPVRAQALPRIVVTKDPTCGCCTAWADHLRRAGFPVDMVETAEIGRVKARLGVPASLASCHTAEVGAYVIEGFGPVGQRTFARYRGTAPV
jgi:hypothetical protein